MEQKNTATMLDMSRYLDCDKFSDLKLFYSGTTRAVHKIVLCAASSWFRAALEGPWKESTLSVLSLEGDEPELLNAMLELIYTRQYTVPEDRVSIADALLFHIDAYEIANKYDVPMMRAYAADKFKAILKNLHYTAEVNMEEVRAVYERLSHDNDGLREQVLLCFNYWWPHHRIDFASNTAEAEAVDVKAFADECSEFAVDYLKLLVDLEGMSGRDYQMRARRAGFAISD